MSWSTRRTQAKKLLTGLRTSRGREALRHGVAATGDHRTLLATLAPATVIDVGANRGQFALDVEQAVPSARVYSFEPIAEAAAVYRKIFAGDDRFMLNEIALGAAPGRAVLHISRRDDSSSLLPIGDRQTDVFPGSGEARTESVEVDTLDERFRAIEFASPALLKIDVQGFELEVLRGSRATLDRVRWVYVEASFQEFYDGQPLVADVVEWLQTQRFQLVGIGGTTKVGGRIVQADLLFGRRDGAATGAVAGSP